MLDDRRPDRAREVVAACENGDGEAAPAHEPQRRVGEQRRERRRAARADQQALREREPGERRRRAGGDEAEREQPRAEHHRQHDAVAVGQAAHRDARQPERDHRQRVRQRCGGARDAEFRLHGGQRDDHRPHADATDRRQRQRDEKPLPRGRRFDFTVRHGAGILHGAARPHCAEKQGLLRDGGAPPTASAPRRRKVA